MTSNGNVLITCGGKWVGMTLQVRAAARQVDELAAGSVFVADMASLTPAGHFADRSFVVPAVQAPEYPDALIAICRDHGVRVLVPLIDIDLIHLAPHVHRFAEVGTSVVCPSPDLVELTFDKALFETFCREEALNYPFSIPSGELTSAKFPLFMKRRRGFGSVGSGICSTPKQAEEALARDPDLLFQPLIDGQEYSVDAFINHSGDCTVRVPRVRTKVVGGEAQITTTTRGDDVKELAGGTINALARRGLRGPLNVQVFDTDPPTLIEVNPRLGSASVLSNMASEGRLIRSVLLEACSGQASGDPDDYGIGLSLYRFTGDVFHQGDEIVGAFPDKAEC